jgi:poly(hydroxyalkanoate) granule-associated protein
MASKLKNLKSKAEGNLKQTVRDSAQEIWLAGLGAFSKAQAEGTKVFEALVKEGVGLQQKTKALAEDKLAGMTGNVAKAASQWSRAANDISGKAQSTATETWDKLEQVFEDRVARALNRLGVPTQRDVQVLAKRVEELTASVHSLSGKPARAAAKKAPAKKVARKATK